jgi:23S rRNA (cytosine1962-C5)-methyltransferase
MCERLEGVEDGLKFEIGTDVRHDFGIFTDARAARALVRSEAAGHHVLNLFAYTCGFGLASLQGGAASVCNVDPDKDYLAWGKRNAAANGMDFRVIPDTAQAFLRRAVRRKEARGSGEFDFVIADPPAFGVGRDADRLLRLFWPEMAQLLVALSPSKMVLLFNDKYFRERTSVESFVAERFGTNYEASWINARDCGNALGAVCAAYEDDPYYLTPRAVFLRRKVSLDSGALLESEPQ